MLNSKRHHHHDCIGPASTEFFFCLHMLGLEALDLNGKCPRLNRLEYTVKLVQHKAICTTYYYAFTRCYFLTQ